MVYVDGYVLVIKKKKLKEYTKMARAAGRFWKKYGALEYTETVQDELNPDMQGMKQLGFEKLTKCKKDELVIFSYVVYRSKKHRDSVNKKVMQDEKMIESCKDAKVPFEMNRFCWGGFRSIVR